MKRSDVFEVREPPPHGWTRLSARLTESRTRRPWVLGAAAAAALVVAVVAVMLAAPPRREPPEPLLQRAALAALHGEARGAEPVTWSGQTPGAVLRVPTQDPQVVMYRVAMISSGEEPPTE